MTRRQAVRSGVSARDTRVPGVCVAPPGARRASKPSSGGTRRTLEGNKAHGRIGRSPTSNGRIAQRTRRRSKALESSTPVGDRAVGNGREALHSRSWEVVREDRRARVQRRPSPTSVGSGGSPGDGSASLLNGTPGRSGLRSRGTTTIRSDLAKSDRSLDAEDPRSPRGSHLGGRSRVARHPRPDPGRVEGSPW
jgi:hypothetical protein